MRGEDVEIPEFVEENEFFETDKEHEYGSDDE